MTVPAQPLVYDADIASAAALIADSTRAAILQALLPDRYDALMKDIRRLAQAVGKTIG